MAKTIGIVSLKGGVGKTSVVVSLGAALSERGKKVLLVDGNLSSPNLGLHLNIVNPEKTLQHVLDRSANPSDAIHKFEDMSILPASLYQKFNVNPLKIKDKIRYLKKSYDFILIDSSPALNEETLGVILASDEILVVTTPDHATLSTTLKALKLANQRGTKINGIIINKVYDKRFELDLEDIEKTLEIPVLAVIPHDVGFLESLSSMKPYVKSNSGSKGNEEFKKLAAVLSGEKYRSKKLSEFFRKLTPSRQEINREIFYKSVFEG